MGLGWGPPRPGRVQVRTAVRRRHGRAGRSEEYPEIFGVSNAASVPLGTLERGGDGWVIWPSDPLIGGYSRKLSSSRGQVNEALLYLHVASSLGSEGRGWLVINLALDIGIPPRACEVPCFTPDKRIETRG